MTAEKKQSLLLNLLKFSVFFIFLGRAWQHLFWDAPYRAILWDEDLLKPIVETVLGIPWFEYVTSQATDSAIQGIIISTGIVYLLAAISTLLYTHYQNKLLKYIILFGGWNLVLLAFLLMKEKFYHNAMFFEHSIQFGLPFVFIYYWKEKFVFRNFELLLKILIAIVFVSHGLYAVGYYPVPGKFVDMVIHILHVSEKTAKIFLHTAAFLDFLLAILIFVPKKIARYALGYAFVWGILTAFARIAANFQIDFPIQSLHQELQGTLYRLAHGLVPLIVLLLMKNRMQSAKK
jgi:hypothetical protein